MQTQMKVKLISHTPNAEKLVSASAKLCYSPVGIDKIEEKLTSEKIKDFIDMLMNLHHESPLEHITFTFAIEGVSRSLTHQLVRHRIASYCLSGDTIVLTDLSNRNVKKRTINEIYNMKKQYKDMMHIRCIDEKTLTTVNNKIKNIVYSGVKPVYRVKTKLGYEIKSTLEHRFFTEDGWKQLKEINIGDKVYVNGIDLYKDKEWLKTMYHEKNLSQENIGKICGVSKHAIRAWVRRFNLQKELGNWSKGKEPPNKGKNKYNYEPMLRTSEKMKGNKNALGLIREKNPNFKGDNITISGGYSRSQRYFKKENKCSICGLEGKTEIHHIDKNPINDNIDNLIEVCVKCHKMLHKGYVIKKVILDEIISIEYIGEEKTYDIEMEKPYHNFIANGFVVHNSQQSQRYVKLNHFEYVVPKLIEENPRAKKRFIEEMEKDQKAYNDLVTILLADEIRKYWDYEGVPYDELQNRDDKELIEEFKQNNKRIYKMMEKKAIENARYVFPNACETKIIVTMNARSLLNFFKHRCCNRSQDEIRTLADEMLRLCREVAPNIFKYAGASCVTGKCPEDSMSCGNPRVDLIVK